MNKWVVIGLIISVLVIGFMFYFRKLPISILKWLVTMTVIGLVGLMIYVLALKLQERGNYNG